jgi:hypothetical protein
MSFPPPHPALLLPSKPSWGPRSKNAYVAPIHGYPIRGDISMALDAPSNHQTAERNNGLVPFRPMLSNVAGTGMRQSIWVHSGVPVRQLRYVFFSMSEFG